MTKEKKLNQTDPTKLVFLQLAFVRAHMESVPTMEKTRIKTNKAKATFTGCSPRHGTPRRHQTKPGEDTRTAEGEGHVICEII
jgi:hypothetical protein